MAGTPRTRAVSIFEERDRGARRAAFAAQPGKHDDDQVDALGLIGQLLDKMVVGRSVVKSEEKQTPGYVAYAEMVSCITVPKCLRSNCRDSPAGNVSISARKAANHGARIGTYKPSSAMRPRIDCARRALSPRVGNCVRAT
jgi:hypothetical protein